MEFASEFAGKITSARSVPDVMNAYQSWISKRMALYVEDGRKLFDDGQRVLNTTMKLLSIGRKVLTLRLPISHATGMSTGPGQTGHRPSVQFSRDCPQQT